jgi:hypothetical protein
MDENSRRHGNSCPVCSTVVDKPRTAGIWTGVNRKTGLGISGIGYTATCKECGTVLYSLPTKEEAVAQEYFWLVKEPPSRGYRDEKRDLEGLLRPLLETHCARSFVIERVGLEFSDYSVGSPSHSELRKWRFLDEVNAAAERYPGILFHINNLAMTWLFFDAADKLQGYFIRPA